MRLDERVQSYADKLLLKRQREIDADLKKNIESALKRSTPPGSVLPGFMLQGVVEAYLERIRCLGRARMDSLITAHEHAGIALDKTVLQEIKDQVLPLCHHEQHDIFNKVPRNSSAGVTLAIDDKTTKGIVDAVDSIMADLSLELDIKSDKIGLTEETNKRIYGAATGKRFDAFISHASEDKDYVRRLAEVLQNSGLEIWFDETTLKVGDRLREAIDHGLAKSRYGIVVLSRNFFSFSKHWTREELEGLTTKEIGGVKVILPVWHDITHSEVAEYSPTLAGRLAARSQDGLEKVVRQLREAMGTESLKPSESPKPSGIELRLTSRILGQQEGHIIRRLETTLVNETNKPIEKYELELRLPSSILKHGSGAYPSEVGSDFPGVRCFRFNQAGWGSVRPRDRLSLAAFDYCTACAVPEHEDKLIGAALVSETKVAARIWVDEVEYRVEKTIRQLAEEIGL